MDFLFLKNMSHHIEIWLRDSSKNNTGKPYNQNLDPHRTRIILARPFEVIGSEDKVKDKIIDYCRDFAPIPFHMEDIGNPDYKLYRVSVEEDGRLMEFNNGLEDRIYGDVEFTEEFGKEKNFDVTTSMDGDGFYYPRTNQHMLRVTGIHDEKIWFCYDLVTKDVLPGNMSLDKYKWNETVARFKKEINKRH